MILFRPVGLRELELIAASDWRAFPPRLPHQPIFYPVLTQVYAQAIAQNWNTKDPNSGYAGFVTRFEVSDEFAGRYPVQIVGSRQDQELWVPADELEKFNGQIRGKIRVIASFYGCEFTGDINPATNLPASIGPA
ncbi:MAG TPA: hypothetical protein VFB96_09905 [Pirellulaceae bacterium]|nr:hypothetical protein [Pirellulaceae bacterium]